MGCGLAAEDRPSSSLTTRWDRPGAHETVSSPGAGSGGRSPCVLLSRRRGHRLAGLEPRGTSEMCPPSPRPTRSSIFQKAQPLRAHQAAASY